MSAGICPLEFRIVDLIKENNDIDEIYLKCFNGGKSRLVMKKKRMVQLISPWTISEEMKRCFCHFVVRSTWLTLFRFTFIQKIYSRNVQPAAIFRMWCLPSSFGLLNKYHPNQTINALDMLMLWKPQRWWSNQKKTLPKSIKSENISTAIIVERRWK